MWGKGKVLKHPLLPTHTHTPHLACAWLLLRQMMKHTVTSQISQRRPTEGQTSDPGVHSQPRLASQNVSVTKDGMQLCGHRFWGITHQVWEGLRATHRQNICARKRSIKETEGEESGYLVPKSVLVSQVLLKFGSRAFGATQLFYENIFSSLSGGKQSEQLRANLQSSYPSWPANKTSDS